MMSSSQGSLGKVDTSTSSGSTSSTEDSEQANQANPNSLYSTSGLKKVDIASVEKKGYHRSSKSILYTKNQLKKVALPPKGESNGCKDDLESSSTSLLPVEFDEAKKRLSKIDIATIENKSKRPSSSSSSDTTPDDVGKAYTKVILKKVNKVSAVISSEKNKDEKNTVPTQHQLPSEFFETKRRLSKVEVVENKYKKQPQKEATNMSSEERPVLKRVDIVSVPPRKAAEPELSSFGEEFSVKRLSKVKQPATTKPPLRDASTFPIRVSLKKVTPSVDSSSKASCEAKKQEEEDRRSSLFISSRASLRKVNVEQIQQMKKEASQRSLLPSPTVTLKKAVIVKHPEGETTTAAAPPPLPIEFSPSRLSHNNKKVSTPTTSSVQKSTLPSEFSPNRLRHTDGKKIEKPTTNHALMLSVVGDSGEQDEQHPELLPTPAIE
eukprot:scaffold2738_cov119-Cylindrotheca_fusiformis.AAC.4